MTIEYGFQFIEDHRMPPDTIAFVGGPLEVRAHLAKLPGGGMVLTYSADLIRMAELGRVVILKGFSL